MNYSGKTCSRKVVAMTSAYTPNYLEECRYHCPVDFGEDCRMFISVDQAHENIRRGRIADRLSRLVLAEAVQ